MLLLHVFSSTTLLTKGVNSTLPLLAYQGIVEVRGVRAISTSLRYLASPSILPDAWQLVHLQREAQNVLYLSCE